MEEITIAVCDDDRSDLKRLCEGVLKWLNYRNDVRGKIVSFSAASEMLGQIRDGKRFDVFLMDIMMSEIDGIEAGREIIGRDGDAPIIYISNSEEFAFAAYGNRAIRYILKPFDQETLNSALDFAYVVKNAKSHKHIAVKQDRIIKSIDVDDILYVENDVRVMTYTVRGGEKIFVRRRNTSFETALEPLSEYPFFIQTHKSFLVNMKFISSLNANEIKMDDGTVIPVSRSRLTDVKRAYIEFITNGK